MADTPRTLSQADLEALADLLRCKNDICTFSSEEVQFVRDWLDTAKTAKSEFVRWLVRSVMWIIGIASGIAVAAKLGYFKSH